VYLLYKSTVTSVLPIVESDVITCKLKAQYTNYLISGSSNILSVYWFIQHFIWFTNHPTFYLISRLSNILWLMVHPTFYLIHASSNILFDFWFIQHFIWFLVHPTFYLISGSSNILSDFWFIQHFIWFLVHPTFYLIHGSSNILSDWPRHLTLWILGLAWERHINMVGLNGVWELNPPLLITGHRTAIHIYAQIRFYSINHIL
jgi:hypothetical protein